MWSYFTCKELNMPIAWLIFMILAYYCGIDTKKPFQLRLKLLKLTYEIDVFAKKYSTRITIVILEETNNFSQKINYNKNAER